ncbi:MAG: hypothetical protein JWM09_79 [Francisellaceae bacterium]|nr:hypothetical protein [Francisellaceae bacterium]
MMYRTLLFLALILQNYSIYAKEVVASIFLTEIKCLNPSCLNKEDKLYISIKPILSEDELLEFQTPLYPLYWSSQMLKKIKNELLWQEKIEDKDINEFEIALMSRSIGSDQYLGSHLLKINSNYSPFKIQWIPIKKHSPKKTIKESDTDTVIFKHGNCQYLLNFKAILNNI